MKHTLKTLCKRLLTRATLLLMSLMRRAVSSQERAILYVSEIRQTTEPLERTRLYLAEIKQIIPSDAFFNTLRDELEQLLPPEERYLLPSFVKGHGKETERFRYQAALINFDILDNEKVLDIGSGGDPFPYATHLADLYEGETGHRAAPLVQDSRPFQVVNIEKMPYGDKEFDFVYCSHVLEHVADPSRACDELMRIGRRGYIETPTRLSDIMLNFTHLPEHHKWYIVAAGNVLFFFEWSDKDCRNTGHDEFFHMHHSPYQNPFQDLIHSHRDLFVNMFLWEKSFAYYVFSKNGNLKGTNQHNV